MRSLYICHFSTQCVCVLLEPLFRATQHVASWRGIQYMFERLIRSFPLPPLVAGIAIGIAIADTYNESSATALWVQGLLGAFASGILIYAGLVEMIIEDFTRCRNASTVHRLAMYFSVLLGYTCMTVLALWA